MYIVSHESASVEFPRYVRTKAGIDIKGSVLINGGAGVINKKTMETPKGVVTEVTKEELEFLKTQSLFNEKVEAGSYEIVDGEKEAKKKEKLMKKAEKAEKPKVDKKPVEIPEGCVTIGDFEKLSFRTAKVLACRFSPSFLIASYTAARSAGERNGVWVRTSLS